MDCHEQHPPYGTNDLFLQYSLPLKQHARRWAGKSTVALHFAHAAALDGYRVLCVDFDPQATLSHSMGLTDVNEEHTVWGIMARDLVRETERMNRAAQGAESGAALPRRKLPSQITEMGLGELRVADFIKPTSWPTIDIVPSCANAVPAKGTTRAAISAALRRLRLGASVLPTDMW